MSADDLRDLLGSSFPDPVLVLDEGRLHTVDAAHTDERSKAFVVVTRDELRQQLPQDREHTDTDLELLASTLGSTVANLGG
ncbi:hypothetical protein [Rhodococcus coprophilus]|uniref:Uncharacterized protein n=1 Tax=Rhodococcus coprophilus TaxID=38310 RepID=A0A2X4TPX2_9NOCA|nr:hypothetical protein [Rhodococcus coprophilus]MBM7461151.1 hypothetical protein [Rhodococcus coprophilus]SQI28953.1 Uncharacterised protein [Rhodococcus coprophilus]